MAFSTVPATLLLMTLSLLSAEETDPLVVIYPQRTITAGVGSLVKLSCETEYDLKECGTVHAVWQKIEENFKLTDPLRYFTTVSETVTENGMRRRLVVTEITSVKSGDRGQYQCVAKCETGEQAMGHFITIHVINRSYD